MYVEKSVYNREIISDISKISKIISKIIGNNFNVMPLKLWLIWPVYNGPFVLLLYIPKWLGSSLFYVELIYFNV